MNPRADRFRLIISEHDKELRAETLNRLENNFETSQKELKRLKAVLEKLGIDPNNPPDQYPPKK